MPCTHPADKPHMRAGKEGQYTHALWGRGLSTGPCQWSAIFDTSIVDVDVSIVAGGVPIVDVDIPLVDVDVSIGNADINRS